jgi:hypothetical protein
MATEDSKEIEKRNIALISSVASIIKTFFWASATFGIFYFGFDALKAFAGEFSTADLNFIASGEVNKWVPVLISILIGGPGFAYGWRQRKLRKKYIDRYTERIKILEKYIDPDRSSSGLTSTGETPPED